MLEPGRQPGSQPEAHGWVSPPTHTQASRQAGVWRMSISHPVEVKGMLVFDKLVHMMLCPMLAGGDFKDKSNDQQGLLRVPTCDHLRGQGGREQGLSKEPRLGRLDSKLARSPRSAHQPRTCRMVKFSSTLFIMYFSGRCLSLWMKLIMYSHMGERWMRYTKRPFSRRAYSVCRVGQEGE